MKKYIAPTTMAVSLHAEETMVVATSLQKNDANEADNISNSADIWTQKKGDGFGQSPWED